MQTRKMRACGIAAGLLAALASYGVSAETPATRRPETSLLGIRLLSGYSDVLRKFGQPNEIQVGDPTISGQGMAAAPTGQTGGFPGMGGPMGSGGYPGMSGGPMMGRGGYPGMAGGPPPGMGYPGMSGGPMGGSGMPGMGRKGGLPGMAGGPMGGSGYPGMAGGPMGGSGYPGMGGAAGAGGAGATEESGETTWWYHFPRQGLHYSFLFNKEGRVIQIQAYGQKPSSKIVAPRSAQGITLGTDLGQVISKYGWSNDGEHSGDYVVMRYGQRDRIAFQSRHNKVLGIVLGRVNPQPPAGPEGPGGMGYPGGMGGYTGGMGYPGMGGSGMGYPGGPGGFPGGFPGRPGGFPGRPGGGDDGK